jgi:hypothetical protein
MWPISLPFNLCFRFVIQFIFIFLLTFMQFSALPRFYEFASQHLQEVCYDSITALSLLPVCCHTNGPLFKVFFAANKF